MRKISTFFFFNTKLEDKKSLSALLWRTLPGLTLSTLPTIMAAAIPSLSGHRLDPQERTGDAQKAFWGEEPIWGRTAPRQEPGHSPLPAPRSLASMKARAGVRCKHKLYLKAHTYKKKRETEKENVS